ncbi:MAG: site-2 protease family protein [Promethearchaeota archaeon]
MAPDFLLALVLNPIVLVSAIFWILAYISHWSFKRRNSKAMVFMFPFLVMLRTKRLNKWLTRVGRRWARFWKGFWSVGVFISFGFLVFAVYFLTANLVHLILDPRPENYIAPLIPGVTVSVDIFIYLILPILVNLTIHEFSHAMAATSEGIKLQSTGLLAVGLGILVGFGAFVEPDEALVRSRKVKKRTRVRVAAAGTFSNAIIAGISFLLLANFGAVISPSFGPHVSRITRVLTGAEGGYNEGVVQTGEVILAVGGVAVDRDSGVDLPSILSNQTGAKFTPGTTTNLTLFSPSTGETFNKTVTLGPRTFLGIATEKVNNSAIRVTDVYSTLQGGNNDGKIPAGTVVTRFNGTQIDFGANQTLERFLLGVYPPSQVLLTAINGTEYRLKVDYFPRLPAAHQFDNFYLGFVVEEKDGNPSEVVVSHLVNVTDLDPDNKLEVNDIIVAVNGSHFSTEGLTFEDLLRDVISPEPGDELLFQLEDGSVKRVLVQKVPVISIFVGIQSEDYWIPKNFLAGTLGGTFPTVFLRQTVYFWIVAFSLTLFNMLPFPIFDGDRIVKEVLSGIFGTNYKKQRKRDAQLVYKSSSTEYMFPDLEVEEVHSVVVVDTGTTLKEGTDYELTGGSEDSTIKNTISLAPLVERQRESNQEQEGVTMLEDGMKISIDYEYWEDEKWPLKRRILTGMRAFSAVILLGNFVLSFWKLGVVAFWV